MLAACGICPKTGTGDLCEYLTGIRAENFLMEKGYVVYYANSVQHRFCIGFGAKSRMMLLTAEQKDFIVANLSNALPVGQRKSMEALLRQDEECQEKSVLSRMEAKYLQ